MPRESANEAAAPAAATDVEEARDKDSSAERDEEEHGSGNFVVVDHAGTNDEISWVLGASGGYFFTAGSGSHL